MDKRKTISEFMIGEKIEGVFVLSNLSVTKGSLTATFKDKSGECIGTFTYEVKEEDIRPLVNGAVKASFIVKPGQNGAKVVSIKSLVKAEKSEYKSSDLFDGLDEKIVEKYETFIKNTLAKGVRNEELRALIKATFTEEMFMKLRTYPATVKGLGTYKGGALALTANILALAKNIGISYVTLSNGLHSDNVDWSLILTAAALKFITVSEAYTECEPFAKKVSCIERGYSSLLQSYIDRIIAKNALILSEETYSKLLNCLWCVGEQSAHISPTSKEGIILQMAYSTYSRLDYFDFYKANNSDLLTEESGYSYSTGNKSYVDLKEVPNPNVNAS